MIIKKGHLGNRISCLGVALQVLLCTSTGKKGLSCCRWKVDYLFSLLFEISLLSAFNCLFRFLKVMAMVWAGSQVTKLARAGGSVTKQQFFLINFCGFSFEIEFYLFKNHFEFH